jgi:hypothetical protein
MILDYWELFADYTGLTFDLGMALISVIFLILIFGKVGK